MNWFKKILGKLRRTRFGVPQQYRDGKYLVTQHAAERMKERKISKKEVHCNLHGKPIYISPVRYDKLNRPSYERYSKNRINTRINPDNNHVATVSRYSPKRLEQKIRKVRGK